MIEYQAKNLMRNRIGKSYDKPKTQIQGPKHKPMVVFCSTGTQQLQNYCTIQCTVSTTYYCSIMTVLPDVGRDLRDLMQQWREKLPDSVSFLSGMHTHCFYFI